MFLPFKILRITYCKCKVFAPIILVFISCLKCTNSNSQSEKNNTSEAKKEKINITPTIITYKTDTISDASALQAFKTTYTTDQQQIIAACNRIDLSRIRIGSKLVIPDTLFSDFKNYVPFPQQLTLPDSISKLILVNQRIQLFAAYENGKLVRTGPISSGRQAKPTPNKLYYTNYKAKKKISTVDGSWVMPWYFNISNQGGIGMHQYTLPGYPASHSCIRMYETNAQWIFNWAQPWVLTPDQKTILTNGTPVLVFGTYDFTQPAPWISLPTNPQALILTPEELQTIQSNILLIKIHH